MSVNYNASVMYGYKLNPQETIDVFNYLREADLEEYTDEYFYRLGLDLEDGAIFGIEISKVYECEAKLISSLEPTSPEATNMSWAWSLNSRCSEIAPNARKGVYLCCFVG